MSVLLVGGYFMSTLKPQFFPKDLSYLSYVDVWLPPDAPLGATDGVAARAETVIREEAERFSKEHHADRVLKTLTTFIGGGGPRFWFSVDPEQRQVNYAQILVEVTDKHFTNDLIGPLQTALTREVPGARVDVRQLETGKPVGIPISIRISGADTAVLHQLSTELQAIFRAEPNATRVRDDWGEPTMTVRLGVDPERANLSGVTNLDVARSSTAALSGLQVSTYREGDKQIPIAVRLRMEDRAAVSDVQNTYVYSRHQQSAGAAGPGVERHHGDDHPEDQAPESVPHGHGVSVPDPGSPALGNPHTRDAENRGLPEDAPPGYFLEIGGEYDEQVKGFDQLSVAMAVSVASSIWRWCCSSATRSSRCSCSPPSRTECLEPLPASPSWASRSGSWGSSASRAWSGSSSATSSCCSISSKRRTSTVHPFAKRSWMRALCGCGR